MRFASELLERAAAERGKRDSVPVKPGIIEQFRAFWASQTLFARFASSFAAIVIVAGLALLSLPGNRPVATYAEVNLQINSSERSTGSEIKRVRLESGTGVIRINLTLPDQTPPNKSYRVELIDEQQNSRNLPVEQQTDRMLVVTVPASDLKPGTYVIHLYEVKPDGTEQRVRGSYSFAADFH